MNGGEILLADDNSKDEALIDRSLLRAGVNNPVDVVRDGDEALGYLMAWHRRPSV